jgi:hypothetical protein
LNRRAKFAVLSLVGLLALATGRGAGQQPAPAPGAHDHSNHSMPAATSPRDAERGMSPQAQAEAEATQAMQPGHEMHGAHMRMTPRRPATPKDLARAEEIVAILRDVLEPYRDYRVAIADGYRIFMPDLRQREYHFNNYWNGFLEGFTFDPARPTSLLYRKTRDGYELTGAMFTASKSATLEQLDERVPLSIAQWHAHVNLCLPPRGSGPRFDGKRFGLSGSIATADACREASGQFFPQIFGWMVHVYPFAAPEEIWEQ